MKNALLLAVTLCLSLQAADNSGFADRRYRLQPSDRLDLAFRYSPEYDETLTLMPDGFVSLKLVGEIKLEGLTLDEARGAILTAVSARLHNPEITLKVLDYVRPSFVVAGQVGAPGKYEMHGRVSAVEAIAMAGGFKDAAKHSQVILFHRINPEMAQTHVLNMKKMMDPNHPHLEESIDIQPGDLLVVPKNRVSKIADYVHWVGVGSTLPL